MVLRLVLLVVALVGACAASNEARYHLGDPLQMCWVNQALLGEGDSICQGMTVRWMEPLPQSLVAGNQFTATFQTQYNLSKAGAGAWFVAAELLACDVTLGFCTPFSTQFVEGKSFYRSSSTKNPVGLLNITSDDYAAGLLPIGARANESTVVDANGVVSRVITFTNLTLQLRLPKAGSYNIVVHVTSLVAGRLLWDVCRGPQADMVPNTVQRIVIAEKLKELEIHPAAIAVMSLLAVLVAIMAVVFLVLALACARHPVFRATGMTFTLLVIPSSLLSLLSMVLFAVTPTDTSCILLPFFLSVPASVAIGAVLCKQLYYVHVARKHKLVPPKRRTPRRWWMVLFSLGCGTVAFAIAVFWLVLDGFMQLDTSNGDTKPLGTVPSGGGANVSLTTVPKEPNSVRLRSAKYFDQSGNWWDTCSTKDPEALMGFGVTLIIYVIVLLLLSIFSRFMWARGRSFFNERKWLMFASIHVAGCVAIFCPVSVVLPEPTSAYLLRSFGLLLGVGGGLLMIYGPKIFMVATRRNREFLTGAIADSGAESDNTSDTSSVITATDGGSSASGSLMTASVSPSSTLGSSAIGSSLGSSSIGSETSAVELESMSRADVRARKAAVRAWARGCEHGKFKDSVTSLLQQLHNAVSEVIDSQLSGMRVQSNDVKNVQQLLDEVHRTLNLKDETKQREAEKPKTGDFPVGSLPFLVDLISEYADS